VCGRVSPYEYSSRSHMEAIGKMGSTYERVVHIPMKITGKTADNKHYVVEHVDRNVDISGWLPVDGIQDYLSDSPKCADHRGCRADGVPI